jgi:hypothetical protein
VQNEKVKKRKPLIWRRNSVFFSMGKSNSKKLRSSGRVL